MLKINSVKTTLLVKEENKIIKKACLVLLLSMTLISCSQTPYSANISSTENVTTFKVSDKNSAEISFKIITTNNNEHEFNTKANTNGTSNAKTPADIDHFIVYLIKDSSATSYPLNGDPLNSSNIVAGPYTVTNAGINAIKFTGVNNIVSGAYYVAVRAQDSSNNDLIKINNGSGTAWTGTTAGSPFNGKVAVSSGAGITVNSSYAVSTNTGLTVTANLTDSTGAGISAQTLLNQTNTNPVTKSLGYTITTVAGTGTGGYSGDGGQATNAKITSTSDVKLDSSNNLYILDTTSSVLRKVNSSTGNISTIAGTGTLGYNADNIQATTAQLNQPSEIAIDSSGNIYIADSVNNRIRKVTVATGVITTVAGNGTYGSSGDSGQATNATLRMPNGVAVDSLGNLYIGELNKIRKVDTSGVITTFAGTATSGFSGDGGKANVAQVNNPASLVFDSSYNLYFVDSGNNRIRKINNATGIITTIVGTGTSGYNGDNIQASSAQINGTDGLALDTSGNLYISDKNNYRVRKVNVSTGVITTIVGTGTSGYNGDNIPSSNAQLNGTRGLDVDSTGKVYIGDDSNRRVRIIN